MDKKKYTTPCIEVVNIQTGGVLSTSDDTLNMPWSGKEPGTAGPDDIDDYSTFDSF